jgi:hypothetical protein
MNRGRNTAILAALAVAMGAYIFFVDRHRESAPDLGPDAPVGKIFTGLDQEKIGEITILSSKGESTTLRKTNGAWRITAPIDVPADVTEASNVASNLASADVQRVVDEQPKDLATYGLATPKITVTFQVTGEKTPRRLLIGEKNPSGSDLYAKVPDSPRVLLVSGYLEGTFDRGPFAFRDKHVLAFDREKIDRLAMAAGTQTVTVTRKDDAWSVTAPVAARADFGVIESVLSRLSNGQMKAIAWDPTAPAAAPAATAPGTKAPRALKDFGLDPAERRITLAAGSATHEILLGKPTPEGDVYAKDATRPFVFTVEKALADDLARTPADFRSKDVFGFRAFTGTRLEIVRGGKTATYEKKKGTGQGAGAIWSAVAPTKAADEPRIDDLVTKVANLRAESFVDALPAGTTELARVQTAYDEGRKHDVVVLHQVGASDYYAVRQGDAGAAKLIAPAVTEMLAALDAAQK